MGVKLSSTVTVLDVDLGLVDEANDLIVARGLDVLQTGDVTGGNDASTTALLGAPGDFLALSVGDRRVGLCGCPDAPVCGRSVR